MIEYELIYKEKTKTIRLFHEWDVKGSEVVGWDCTKSDVGKFIKFDDGSELYAKIIGVSDDAIRTEIGVFRRDDIVHCCIPKWHNANYSGVLSKEEHPFVRAYSHREKGTVTRLLNGEDIPGKFITPRIKMLTLERLKEASDKIAIRILEDGTVVKIDADFVMGQLAEGIKTVQGRNFPFCMKAVCRVHGIDIEKVPDAIDTRVPAFHGMIEGSGRRNGSTQIATNVKVLKNLIKSVTDKSNAQEIIIEE